MIFKPISDLVQLDQSKISDSMLLVRSGAENDATDSKLTISNLVNKIKQQSSSTGIRKNILNEDYFANGKTLNFGTYNINNQPVRAFICPGISTSWGSGWGTDEIVGSLHFGISTPYFIDFTDLGDKELYIRQMDIRVRAAQGTTVLVGGTQSEHTFTDISSQYIKLINNGVLSSSYTNAVKENVITNISFSFPSQIIIEIPVFNNLRYMDRTAGTPATQVPTPDDNNTHLLNDDTPCTATVCLDIGLRIKQNEQEG